MKTNLPFDDSISAGGFNLLEAPTVGEIVELRLLKPNPNQPRRSFPEDSLKDLAKSIEEKGILQPILVRRVGKSYEIVAGERRFRAAKLIDLQEMPVIIQSFSDTEAAELALIENLQREDLNPYEETQALLALVTHYLELHDSETTVAKLKQAAYEIRSLEEPSEASLELEAYLANFGVKLRSFLTNKLPLLELHDLLKEKLASGELAYTKALHLQKLAEDNAALTTALQKTLDEELGTQAVKVLVAKLLKKDTPQENSLPKRVRRLGPKLKLLKGKDLKKVEKLLDQIEKIVTP